MTSGTGARPSTYREWAAAPGNRVVRCWWEQRVDPAGDQVQRVLPDGASDILVFADGTAFLAGPTMEVATPTLTAATRLRGLRLKTEALAGVFGVPGHELRDQFVPLDAVLAPTAASDVAASIRKGQVPALVRDAASDRRVRHAVDRLSKASLTPAEVADEVGVTERQLRRLLDHHTGLGPTALRRVGRLQRVLDLADSGWPQVPLADLAFRTGFADQPHLTREVRDLTGLTPKALFAERASSPSL